MFSWSRIMRRSPYDFAKSALTIAGVSLPPALLSGCVSIQAIEPVIKPPAAFREDITVAVEFLPPALVGLRCARRGATFLGLPGINSNACADAELISITDPCLTVTAGAYALAMCEGRRLAQSQGGDLMDEPSLAPPLSPAPLQTEIGLQLTPIGFSVSRAPAVVDVSVPSATTGGPPAGDTTPAAGALMVEFVEPEKVAYRCAERGAILVDTPVSGVLACADRFMITFVNPCKLEDGGWYAVQQCHELAHSNGWPPDHSSLQRRGSGRILAASQSPQALALAAQAARAAEPSLREEVETGESAIVDIFLSPLTFDEIMGQLTLLDERSRTQANLAVSESAAVTTDALQGQDDLVAVSESSFGRAATEPFMSSFAGSPQPDGSLAEPPRALALSISVEPQIPAPWDLSAP
jgi:hypothetical protein